MSKSARAPAISTTGLGYHFARDESGGRYDTVYVHQLCAIAGGADPHRVFADQTDVHHLPLSEWLDLDEHVPPSPIEVGDISLPAIDTPDSVEVRNQWEHRSQNLRGVSDD
ncbi:hypothetical protein [Halorhabdus salina]|uniref:hypothetical protein n=1 Tax=Halorhabdus salina TaxID=2750670 RepID=UPI0015EE3C3E|nr:hypothetical protein [Halorhabdus salina]